MDMALAQCVRACVFDFDAVAAALRVPGACADIAPDGAGAAPAGAAGLWAVPKVEASRVSADACRLRWAQLDVAQWDGADDAGGAESPAAMLSRARFVDRRGEPRRRRIPPRRG